jgi:hypothetical protein
MMFNAISWPPSGVPILKTHIPPNLVAINVDIVRGLEPQANHARADLLDQDLDSAVGDHDRLPFAARQNQQRLLLKVGRLRSIAGDRQTLLASLPIRRPAAIHRHQQTSSRHARRDEPFPNLVFAARWGRSRHRSVDHRLDAVADLDQLVDG